MHRAMRDPHIIKSDHLLRSDWRVGDDPIAKPGNIQTVSVNAPPRLTRFRRTENIEALRRVGGVAVRIHAGAAQDQVFHFNIIAVLDAHAKRIAGVNGRPALSVRTDNDWRFGGTRSTSNQQIPGEMISTFEEDRIAGIKGGPIGAVDGFPGLIG